MAATACPTHPVDLVHTGDGRCGQCGVVHLSVRAGWDAQDDLRHPGHLGRNGTHQHCGRIPGPASGRVAAGPALRPDQVADFDATRLEVAGGLTAGFVGVVGQNPVVGDIEGVLQRPGHPPQSSLDLLLRHPEPVQIHTVELVGEAAHRGVTVPPDLAQDGRHVGGTLRLAVGRSGKGLLQLTAAAGEPAEIETTESHSPTMLPDRRRSPGCPAVGARRGHAGAFPTRRRSRSGGVSTR